MATNLVKWSFEGKETPHAFKDLTTLDSWIQGCLNAVP